VNRKSATAGPALRAENAELRARLEDAEEMLRAIRAGEVDALVMEGAAGHVAAIRAITKRKQAEEAVARLAAIVESSHDALFGEDLDGIVTSWNRGAEQIFGYRAEEIVGTSIMRLIPADGQAAEHELQR
jgi:PAS domain-containing protein